MLSCLTVCFTLFVFARQGVEGIRCMKGAEKVILSPVECPEGVTSCQQVNNHRLQEQKGDKFDCGPLIEPRARCEPFRQIQEDEITARVCYCEGDLCNKNSIDVNGVGIDDSIQFPDDDSGAIVFPDDGDHQDDHGSGMMSSADSNVESAVNLLTFISAIAINFII